MHTNRVTLQHRGEVRDFLEDANTFLASILRNQTDRPSRRGDVGVAFASEPTKHSRHLNAITLRDELIRILLVPLLFTWSMQLNRGDLQFFRNFQMNTKPVIDGRKHTNGPLRHLYLLHDFRKPIW